MSIEIQELREDWRRLLCKRSYLNKVALPAPGSPHFFAYAGTVETMENAGWLHRIDETPGLEIYQLTPEVLAQIRLAYQKRDEAIREPSIFRRIEQPDMFDVIDQLHLTTQIPQGTVTLHANPDVFAPDMFTLVIDHDFQGSITRFALDALVRTVPREKHWYAGALLNPAPNEYHLTFWAQP